MNETLDDIIKDFILAKSDTDKRIQKMKNYLEDCLNNYIDNDQEKEMLTVQDICMKFFEIFE